MKKYQITQWCHHFLREHIKEGDFCIDATSGNGNDTLLLCQLVGKTGKVIGFDIQEAAITATKQVLLSAGLADRARLLLKSHTHMSEYAGECTVDCIVFNFGYLPTGDHAIATRPDTSIDAIRQGLLLLKKGGLMSLCIYSGGDSGFAERDALLAYLKELDSRCYIVILSSYYNRPNHPPIPVLIYKMKLSSEGV